MTLVWRGQHQNISDARSGAGRAWAHKRINMTGNPPMSPAFRPSRRQFAKSVGLAAGAAGLGVAAIGAAPAAADPPATRDADAVLAHLMEGNKRFVRGETSLLNRRRPSDFAALAEGQAPVAVIFTCVDSRVPPELIFDQGIGDLFVIRVAGNIVSGAGPVMKGSVEYAVAELNVKLIMVLGHGKCGAVDAAIQHIGANDKLPGAIDAMIHMIEPAVTSAKDLPGDRLENTIKANVRHGVERLRTLDPILSKQVESGGLKVVGAVYNLATGAVEMVD